MASAAPVAKETMERAIKGWLPMKQNSLLTASTLHGCVGSDLAMPAAVATTRREGAREVWSSDSIPAQNGKSTVGSSVVAAELKKEKRN
jgi:hypothetical protein